MYMVGGCGRWAWALRWPASLDPPALPALLTAGLSSLQVVLMSATINCKQFANYFAVPVQNKMNPAYVFEVEGKPHAIEEYYLNDLGHIYHSGVCWDTLLLL